MASIIFAMLCNCHHNLFPKLLHCPTVSSHDFKRCSLWVGKLRQDASLDHHNPGLGIFVVNRAWLEFNPHFPVARQDVQHTPAQSFTAALLILSPQHSHPDRARTCPPRQLRGGERAHSFAHSFCALILGQALCCAHACLFCKGLLPALTPHPDHTTYFQESSPDSPNSSGDLGIHVTVWSRWDRRKWCFRRWKEEWGRPSTQMANLSLPTHIGFSGQP